jgi:hypothetical protein
MLGKGILKILKPVMLIGAGAKEEGELIFLVMETLDSHYQPFSVHLYKTEVEYQQRGLVFLSLFFFSDPLI